MHRNNVEQNLIDLVPDSAWNAILSGSRLDAVRILREKLNIDLVHADSISKKMEMALGMREEYE